MAQNYHCDICQEVAADFMITDIHDGSVMAVGVECLLDWALPIVEAFQAAQERERAQQAGPEGDPGTVQAGGFDTPVLPVIGPTDGPDGPEGPPDEGDGESEGGDSPRAPRARKRAPAVTSDGGGEDTEDQAAPHVAG